jgi:hypothetical protein
LNQEKEPLMGCGADTEANELISDLTTDISFETPAIDLDAVIFKLPGDETIPMYGQVMPLTNADLTTGEISGSGSFDALMRGFKAHLAQEFEKGRITGAEYAKTYSTLTQNAMAAAVQFLLGRDQAYWAAQLSQLQAITARVQLETTKVQLAQVQLEALNSKANYALTKMRLSSESMAYCIAKYNLENTLPAQKNQILQQTENLAQEKLNLVSEKARIDQQIENLTTENGIQTYNLSFMLPKQLEMLTAQVAQQITETDISEYNLSNLLPGQLAKLQAETLNVEQQTDIGEYQINYILPKQLALTNEQVETQRSQTLDTRTDGATIVGSVGKQKELYSQQITSYQRDAEVKAAKIFTDAWITQKTIDEGLLPPTGFTNASIDDVLDVVKANNGF